MAVQTGPVHAPSQRAVINIGDEWHYIHSISDIDGLIARLNQLVEVEGDSPKEYGDNNREQILRCILSQNASLLKLWNDSQKDTAKFMNALKLNEEEVPWLKEELEKIKKDTAINLHTKVSYGLDADAVQPGEITVYNKDGNPGGVLPESLQGLPALTGMLSQMSQGLQSGPAVPVPVAINSQNVLNVFKQFQLVQEILKLKSNSKNNEQFIIAINANASLCANFSERLGMRMVGGELTKGLSLADLPHIKSLCSQVNPFLADVVFNNKSSASFFKTLSVIRNSESFNEMSEAIFELYADRVSSELQSEFADFQNVMGVINDMNTRGNITESQKTEIVKMVKDGFSSDRPINMKLLSNELKTEVKKIIPTLPGATKADDKVWHQFRLELLSAKDISAALGLITGVKTKLSSPDNYVKGSFYEKLETAFSADVSLLASLSMSEKNNLLNVIKYPKYYKADKELDNTLKACQSNQKDHAAYRALVKKCVANMGQYSSDALLTTIDRGQMLLNLNKILSNFPVPTAAQRHVYRLQVENVKRKMANLKAIIDAGDLSEEDKDALGELYNKLIEDAGAIEKTTSTAQDVADFCTNFDGEYAKLQQRDKFKEQADEDVDLKRGAALQHGKGDSVTMSQRVSPAMEAAANSSVYKSDKYKKAASIADTYKHAALIPDYAKPGRDRLLQLLALLQQESNNVNSNVLSGPVKNLGGGMAWSQRNRTNIFDKTNKKTTQRTAYLAEVLDYVATGVGAEIHGLQSDLEKMSAPGSARDPVKEATLKTKIGELHEFHDVCKILEEEIQFMSNISYHKCKFTEQYFEQRMNNMMMLMDKHNFDKALRDEFAESMRNIFMENVLKKDFYKDPDAEWGSWLMNKGDKLSNQFKDWTGQTRAVRAGAIEMDGTDPFMALDDLSQRGYVLGSKGGALTVSYNAYWERNVTKGLGMRLKSSTDTSVGLLREFSNNSVARIVNDPAMKGLGLSEKSPFNVKFVGEGKESPEQALAFILAIKEQAVRMNKDLYLRDPNTQKVFVVRGDTNEFSSEFKSVVNHWANKQVSTKKMSAGTALLRSGYEWKGVINPFKSTDRHIKVGDEQYQMKKGGEFVNPSDCADAFETQFQLRVNAKQAEQFDHHNTLSDSLVKPAALTSVATANLDGTQNEQTMIGIKTTDTPPPADDGSSTVTLTQGAPKGKPK